MDVMLDFQNRCDSPSAPSILLFQAHGAAADHAQPVAWKLIRNCAPGWHHPFVFSTTPQVNISDEYGNHVPRLAAANGMAFDLTPLIVGRRFARGQDGGKSDEIVVRNELDEGAVSANLYSNGALVASKSHLAPGMQAVFRFRPALWIALGHRQVEGQSFDSRVLGPCHEISLQGIAGASVVLTDDGDDEENGAFPYRFSLEDVVRF